MKKVALLFLSIIISVAVLGGCAAPVNNKREYFYKFGYNSTREDGLLEHSVYSITAAEDREFASPSDVPEYYLTGSGTYEVKLFSLGENKFKMQTSFVFNGKFYYTQSKTYSEKFQDTIEGESEMLISTTYQPLYSKKTFQKTFNDKDGFKKAHYQINVTYTQGEKGENLTSNVVDLPISGIDESKIVKMSEAKNAEYKVSFDDRYFDNEHILLGMRIQNINDTFTDVFYVANPVEALASPDKIKFSVVADVEDKLTVRTLDGKDYSCITLKGTLQSKFKGQDIVALYSKDYRVTYKNNGMVMVENQNISLVMEFAQEDLTFKLTEFYNYADKL